VCQEDKHESHFYAIKKGLDSTCKGCRNLINKQRRIDKQKTKRQFVKTKNLTSKKAMMAIEKGMKHCSYCVTIKGVEEFHLSKGVLSSCCKKCNKVRQTDRNHRAEVRKGRTRHYRDNIDGYTCKVLQKRYGITLEQYNQKLTQQHGQCFICGRTSKENKKALAVDHDHETGEVRDLLCAKCNLAIGCIEERVDLCDKIKSYLIRHSEDGL
jgi:hypothetical protein